MSSVITNVFSILKSFIGFTRNFETVADAKADKWLRVGQKIHINERDGDFDVIGAVTIVDGEHHIITNNNGNLSFKLRYTDRVSAKNFGATNNINTTENLQAFISFVGEKQIHGELGQGGFYFDRDLLFHRNSNISGVGSSFGSSLVPVGNARIVFRGDLEPGGFVFHASLKNVAVNASLCTIESSEIIFIDNCFSIDIDVRIENINTSTDNKGIHVKRSNDINIGKSTIFGTGTSSGTGILIGDDTTVKIYSPDIEVMNRGIKVAGNANTVVDVVGIYTERNIVSIENLGGQLNLYGGKISNASSSSVAGILNAKTRINDTKVVLSGGTGFTTTSGTNPDVEFRGVDQAVISGDFFTGSNTSQNKNGIYNYSNSFAKLAHADNTYINLFSLESSVANASSIIEIDIWATSNGFGRAYKKVKFLAVKASGGGYGVSIINTDDMTNSGSANYELTVDVNTITATNGVTVQGRFTMTGALNSGNSGNLYAAIKCKSTTNTIKMKTL